MSGGILFIRALIAFLLLPGVFALTLPLLIGYVDSWDSLFFAPGIIVVYIGTIFLLLCIRDFYISGKGTLAPWNPPKNLVIVGLYRFVRNPMYCSILLLVLGWGIFFCSPMLILYDIILFIAFHIHIVKFEEPRLNERFGKFWEVYQENVSRWLPKRTARKSNTKERKQ